MSRHEVSYRAIVTPDWVLVIGKSSCLVSVPVFDAQPNGRPADRRKQFCLSASGTVGATAPPGVTSPRTNPDDTALPGAK